MDRSTTYRHLGAMCPLLLSIVVGCSVSEAGVAEDASSTSSQGETTSGRPPTPTESSAESTDGSSSSASSEATSGSEASSSGGSSGGVSTTADDSGSSGDASGTGSGSTTIAGCDAYGQGTWADCADGEDCMSVDATCVDGDVAGDGTCTFKPAGAMLGCDDVCDCPVPPATGDATVACADVVGPDGVPECYLSCEDGESCPDDQVCAYGGICLHTNAVAYQACDPAEGILCPPGSACVTGGDEVAGCMHLDCEDAGDCPDAPEGGLIACVDVATSPGNECFLQCTDDDDCPDGTTCYMGIACLYPVP